MKRILLILLLCISCVSHGQTSPHWLDLQGKPVFDVRNFLAKGDGETDDTGAIMNALAAASVVGGTVFFPEGTYLTDPIKITADYVSIVGAGKDVSTILLKTPRVGTHYNIIRIGETNNPAHHCAIKNITLDGNRRIQAYEEWSAGVFIVESDYWHLANVKIVDTIGYRVWVGYASASSLRGSNYGLMENCIIEKNPTGATVALVGGCYNVFRDNCIGGAFDAENNPGQAGIVNYNVVTGNRGTMNIVDGPASTTSDLTIYFTSFTLPSIAPRMVGNIITNNQMAKFISFNCSDMVVANNVITGSAPVLIALDDIHSTTVANNTITDTSGGSSSAMIRTRGGVGINVSNNVVNNGANVFHSNFGVWSADYATASQVLFSNNILTGTGYYRANNTMPLFLSERARIKVESTPSAQTQQVTLVSGNLSKLPTVYRYKAVDGVLGTNKWLVTTPSGASYWNLDILPKGALTIGTSTFNTLIFGQQRVRVASPAMKEITLFDNSTGSPTQILADTATCTFFLDIEY